MSKVTPIADKQKPRGENIGDSGGIHHPVIIEGEPFPWHEPNPAGEVVGPDGEVNWMAAAYADPGVMKCPNCGVYLWQEGTVVQCPKCEHQWNAVDEQRRRFGR